MGAPALAQDGPASVPVIGAESFTGDEYQQQSVADELVLIPTLPSPTTTTEKLCVEGKTNIFHLLLSV